MATFAQTLFAPRRRRRAGLYLSSTSAALAVAEPGKGRHVACRAMPLASLDRAAGALAELARSLDGRGASTTLVLGTEFYSLQLIEQPNVPWPEVKDAVRWRIQESIDFPVERALIDVFPLPAAANRGRTASVFVVAADRQRVKPLIDAVSAAGLALESVDITELALRDVAKTLYPSPEHALGLLRITPTSGTVNVTRGDELFLSRRISGIPASLDSPSWDRFKDALLLQVQRSIDYYESALAQPAANGLLVAAAHEWAPRIVEYLGEMLPLPVRAIAAVVAEELELALHNPSAKTLVSNELTDSEQQAVAALLPALGGCLRPMEASAVAA